MRPRDQTLSWERAIKYLNKNSCPHFVLDVTEFPGAQYSTGKVFFLCQILFKFHCNRTDDVYGFIWYSDITDFLVSKLNMLPKFLIFIINSINGHVEKTRVLRYLKRIQTDITFILETRLKMWEQMKVKREWLGHVFASSCNSRSRVVVILIKTCLLLSMKQFVTHLAVLWCFIVKCTQSPGNYWKCTTPTMMRSVSGYSLSTSTKNCRRWL